MSLTIGNNTHPKNVSFGARVATVDIIREVSGFSLTNGGALLRANHRLNKSLGEQIRPLNYAQQNEYRECLKELLIKKFPILEDIKKNIYEFLNKNWKEGMGKVAESKYRSFLKEQIKLFGRDAVDVHFSKKDIEEVRLKNGLPRPLYKKDELAKSKKKFEQAISRGMHPGPAPGTNVRYAMNNRNMTFKIPNPTVDEKVLNAVVAKGMTTSFVENTINKLKFVKDNNGKVHVSEKRAHEILYPSYPKWEKYC